jgi:hypothetical protein
LIDNIKKTPQALQFITNWGLELDSDLYQMYGRTVPNEKICFAQREYETDAKCDWSRPCGNEKVLRSVEFNDWVCVYPGNREQVVEKFVMMAIESAKRIGIFLCMPTTVPLVNDKPDTYYNEVKKSITSRVS